MEAGAASRVTLLTQHTPSSGVPPHPAPVHSSSYPFPIPQELVQLLPMLSAAAGLPPIPVVQPPFIPPYPQHSPQPTPLYPHHSFPYPPPQAAHYPVTPTQPMIPQAPIPPLNYHQQPPSGTLRSSDPLRSSRGPRIIASPSYEARQLRPAEVAGYRAAGILPIAVRPISKTALDKAIAEVIVITKEQKPANINEEEIPLPDLNDLDEEKSESIVVSCVATEENRETIVNAHNHDTTGEEPEKDILQTQGDQHDKLQMGVSNELVQKSEEENAVVPEEEAKDKSDAKEEPSAMKREEVEEILQVPHVLLGVEERYLRDLTGSSKESLGRFINFVGGRRDDENDCDAEYTAIREFTEETGQLVQSLQETLYFRLRSSPQRRVYWHMYGKYSLFPLLLSSSDTLLEAFLQLPDKFSKLTHEDKAGMKDCDMEGLHWVPLPLILAALEKYEEKVGPAGPRFQTEVHPVIRLGESEVKLFGLITSIFSHKFADMRAFLKTVNQASDLSSLPPLPAPQQPQPQQQQSSTAPLPDTPEARRGGWSRSSRESSWDRDPRQQEGGYHVDHYHRATISREEEREWDRSERYTDERDGYGQYDSRGRDERGSGHSRYESQRDRDSSRRGRDDQYTDYARERDDDWRDRERDGREKSSSWRSDWFGGEDEGRKVGRRYDDGENNESREGGAGKRKDKYKGKANKRKRKGQQQDGNEAPPQGKNQGGKNKAKAKGNSTTATTQQPPNKKRKLSRKEKRRQQQMKQKEAQERKQKQLQEKTAQNVEQHAPPSQQEQQEPPPPHQHALEQEQEH